MRLAARTGLPVADLLELDDAELDVVAEDARAATWTQDTELLASILESLWAIEQRLNAGVPVVMTSKAQGFKPRPVPRPEWLQEPKPKTKIVTPRELFAMLQG